MSEFEGMPCRLFGVLVAIALIFSPLDARSASSEANELFVNAVLLHRQAADLPPEERDAKLREVRDLFDRILEEHPDSDAAEQIKTSPAPAGVALADLPPSRDPRDAAGDQGGGSISASDPDPWIVRSAETTAARLCDDAACRQDVAWSLVEWALENGIDDTLDKAFTPKTTFVVDEIVLGPDLRQAYLRKSTDWSATLRPAGGLGGDVVFSILTLFVGEWLAQHYEDNGYRDLAIATRAGFAPLVSTTKATWAAKAIGASGAGLATTNIVLWAKNLHAAHKLGEALVADRSAGRDVESQLTDIQNDIASIQETLLQDRKTGHYWTKDVEGDPLTENERDTLIDNLELFQDLADRLVRANFRLNEQWLTSSVEDLSIWLARSVDRLSEPTALNPTTPAVHPSLDIALPNNDGFAPQLDTVPPAVPPQTSQEVAWEVQADPDVALKPGEQARGFAVSTDGSASFRGQSLFSGYRAPEPDYQRLTIFVDDPERRAVALFMRDGAERIALVDLEAGTVLNDAPRPYWRYGPTDDVIWDPSGRYAALRLPMAEYSTGLGIFELATGRYATIPDRAFDASALDSWLADSLETRPDGTVAVKVAFEKLDAYGTPIASDGTPPETRIIEIEAFFDGSAPESKGLSDETARDPEADTVANQVWDARIVVSEETGIFNRTYGDLVSPIDELHAAGVSEQAIAFSRAFAEATDIGKAGEFVAVAFTELGTLDLVGVEPAYTPGTSSPLGSYVLVAPDGALQRLDFPVEMNRELERYATDRTSRRILAGQPDPWVVDYYVAGHRRLPGGAQRFVLQGPVSGSCRVCEWIGHAIVYVDVDERGDVPRHDLVGVIADSAVPDEEITPADIVTRPDLQQYMLNKFGYNAGPMDGAVGPRTEQAIAAYQRDHCLTVTSSLTGPVARALARSNPLTPPACAASSPDEKMPANALTENAIASSERVPEQAVSIETAPAQDLAHQLARFGGQPVSTTVMPRGTSLTPAEHPGGLAEPGCSFAPAGVDPYLIPRIAGGVEGVGGSLVRRDSKKPAQDLTGLPAADPLSTVPELTRDAALVHLRSLVGGVMVMPEIGDERLKFTADCNMAELLAQLRLIVETSEAQIVPSDIERLDALFDEFNPMSRDLRLIEQGLRRLSLAYDLGLSQIDWQITGLRRYDHSLVPAAPRVELHKVSLQPAPKHNGLAEPLSNRVVLERISVTEVIGIFEDGSTAEVQFRLDAVAGESVSPVAMLRADDLSLDPEFHLFFVENGRKARRLVRDLEAGVLTALYRRYDDGWRLWSVR